MAKKYIYSLSKKSLNSYIGSKASNIHFLLRKGFDVPLSWVIDWTAYDDNLRNRHVTHMALREELKNIINPQKLYAVRSSASVEDSNEFSCAGLFKSYLNASGVDHVMDCITKVWESLESKEFLAYRNHNISMEKEPHMAVIIQEMIQPVYSGVVFTKNPVSGFSETIIEAGIGSGESQAESHGDPERWVSKWGKWYQNPKEGHLNETLAREIVMKATDIANSYNKPADIEWAWDGKHLYFLQVRPITRLDIPVYSNKIAREMLPGIIKPLVWSVNTDLINPVWANILERLTGEKSFNPVDFTGHYYYRAYFNMGIFARVFERFGMPPEALELLFGLEQEGPDKPKMKPGHSFIFRIPRLLAFAISLIGIRYRLNSLVKVKQPKYKEIASDMEGERSAEEWLDLAMKIYDETKLVAHYNIIIPLMAMMHHRLLSNLIKKHGYDLRLVALKGTQEAIVRYNPQHTLQELHKRYFGDLNLNSEDAILSDEKEELLKNEIDQFLQKFGHFSDSGNDCSSIPWRETPELIRRMIINQSGTNIEQELQPFETLKLPFIQGLLIGHIYRRTSGFVVNREEISSLYTFGYGQFRNCFVKLGELLVKQNIIEDKEDIYYLYLDELSELVKSNTPNSQKELVLLRKKSIESYEDVNLPELILGSEQPPVSKAVDDALNGIPTSLGTYSGQAVIVRGIDDFDKIQEGDVLVVPFADVGWTPLFAKAGAVVSESGGILSHASIVAREYRIPAVVSVTGACRIKDGTKITVNGYTGEITLCNDGGESI